MWVDFSTASLCAKVNLRMDEVASELLKPIARVVLAIARGLLWLSWEFMIQTIGWGIGWIICRLVSFETFPKEKISEVDDASWPVAIIVEVVGLVFLACLAYWLTGFVEG